MIRDLDKCLRNVSKLIHPFKSRRSLGRILSTFLCCLAVVIRPYSRLGGNYAFLVLALKELVFSVQENFSQQLELTILNVMGALFGIGFSTLAKYIASLYPVDDGRGRAVCAVFLVAICFVGESSFNLWCWIQPHFQFFNSWFP